jgi:cytosine/adenosine deaminase-related metal-dependent hydrolase
MDAKLGDFEKADVPVDGDKIAAVGPNLAANAAVIDASGMIVMPGFVDTHRHIWQGQLRNTLPNGRLNPDYTRDITGNARNIYRAEDVLVGDTLSAWGAINAGVTTLLDWSHVSTSPEYSDAAVQGLREAGMRGLRLRLRRPRASQQVPRRYRAPAQGAFFDRRSAIDARARHRVRPGALGCGTRGRRPDHAARKRHRVALAARQGDGAGRHLHPLLQPERAGVENDRRHRRRHLDRRTDRDGDGPRHPALSAMHRLQDPDVAQQRRRNGDSRGVLHPDAHDVFPAAHADLHARARR